MLPVRGYFISQDKGDFIVQTIFRTLSIFFVLNAQANVLFSPFESQIAEETGITIPNARFVNRDKKILRSMRPWNRDPVTPSKMSVDPVYVDQIIAAGVTDLLIFKTQEPERDDITMETEVFLSKGLNETQITSIPFPWKGFTDFKEVCLMTLQGLRKIKEVKDDSANNRKILFHCTVGEDRTGYLAALYTLLEEPNLKENPQRIKEIFNEEACRGGYEGGNANKPRAVKASIREALTPLFTKMAFKIQRGYLSWEKLKDEQCEIDPANFESYDYDENFDPEDYTCKKSPDFPDEEE